MSAQRLFQLFQRAAATMQLDLLATPLREVVSEADLPRAAAEEVLVRADALGTLGGLFSPDGVLATEPIRARKAWKELLTALETWVATWPPAPGRAPALPEPFDRVKKAREWFAAHDVASLFEQPISDRYGEQTRYRDGLLQSPDRPFQRPDPDAARAALERQLTLRDAWRRQVESRADVPFLPGAEPIGRALAAVVASKGPGAGVPPHGPPRLRGAGDSWTVSWTTPCNTCRVRPDVTVSASERHCPGGSRVADCAFRRDAIVWSLEALRGTFGPSYARELARPEWLRRIENVAPVTPRRAPSPTEITWRLTFEHGWVTVVPLVHRHGGYLPVGPGEVTTDDARDRLLLRMCHLTHAPVQYVLPELVGHPRVVDGEGRPLSVVSEAAAVTLRRSAEGLQIDLALPDGKSVVRQGRVVGVLLDGDRVHLVQVNPMAGDLVERLRPIVEAAPPEAIGPLIERISALAADVPLDVDPEIAGPEVAADPRPVVLLKREKQGVEMSLRVRPFGTGPTFEPGHGPKRVLRGDPLGQTHRDLDREAALARGVYDEMGMPFDGDVVLDDPEDLATVLDALERLGDRVVVAWEGRPKRRLGAARVRDVRIDVRASRDWLTIGGDADVDGVLVALEALLLAARERRRFVEVEDGLVELGDDLRRHLEDVARTEAGGRMPALAAGDLAALVDAGATTEGDPDWRARVDRCAAAAALAPTVPDGFAGELRPYQRDGYAWLARLASWAPGALLCDDMGLGKTAQALALLLSRADEGAALVVAPTSVVDNWRREAERFAPSLKVVVHQGDRRGRTLFPFPGQLWVTSWDLLVRDQALLTGAGWGTLVLDEVHVAKNPESKRSIATRAIHAGFRVGLTGTPIENRLSDLWAIAAAAVPGLLGAWATFRERFAAPIERDRDDEARRHLGRLLQPFLLRRTKGEVARDLPPRIEIVERLTPTPEERAAYDQERIRALATLSVEGEDSRKRFEVLAALTRLRQLACDPALVGGPTATRSTKVTRLVERLIELKAEGRKALVFSSFTKLLDRAEGALGDEGLTTLRLDGSTPAAARPRLVERFQAGEADAFLISLKAGGTGLNLTVADTVFHLDPWWNPAAEAQAADRAHRIGQTRSVTVYRLVAEGTVEEAVLALQDEKRALVAAVLDETAGAAPVSAQELVALLSFGPDAVAPAPSKPASKPSKPAEEPQRAPTRAPKETPKETPQPTASPPQQASAVPWDEDAFVAWLVEERGLTLASAKVYLGAARRFVAWLSTARRAPDEDAIAGWLATYPSHPRPPVAAARHAVAWLQIETRRLGD